MTKRPSVAIVGTGFSGLSAAIGLKQAGYDDITIFERTDGVGGVWRHNTYPGAACDVASSLYSFSFEPNPHWSRPFAPQPEIQAYLEHCVDKYDLGRHIRFNTEITEATFDDGTGRWMLTDDTGARHEATFFIAACGQLTRPSYPNIPGRESFGGTWFHSAEWDHDHNLTGKRVAVVGNGASAVQLVPEVAKVAGELTVFQRSAEYVVPKPDYPHQRWEHLMYAKVPGALKAFRGAWWTIGEFVNPALVSNWSNRAREAWLAPILAGTKTQLRLQVKDPELRAKLTPDYTIGCKRILLSSSYYPALARENVDVVTESITEVTPAGLVTADGTTHEVDTIIYATGFQSKNFVTPIKVTGLGGADINEAWQDGPAAYLGMNVPGFPNFFLMYGPNTNFGGGSIIYILESQARYIVDAVRQLDRAGGTYLDVKPEVYDEFSAEVQRRLSNSVWATGGCTSWYVDGKGKVTNNWPGLMSEYRRRTKRIDLNKYVVA